MEERGRTTDRHGRVWKATVVRRDDVADDDFRSWFDNLTPEERVLQVEEGLLSSLKAQGINEIPRLQKVARVLKVADAIDRDEM